MWHRGIDSSETGWVPTGGEERRGLLPPFTGNDIMVINVQGEVVLGRGEPCLMLRGDGEPETHEPASELASWFVCCSILD